MFQKKSLGQNFLKNAGALQKIFDAAEIKTGETVLEIGPGEGNLTKKLLDGGARVIAVEKDNRLIPILQEKFSSEISSNQLTLIHDDILTMNTALFSAIAENRADLSPCFMLHATSYKLVANIPYYITGEILRKALSEWPQPSRIVFLVQKEVAERIVARDKKESLLSISVKVYGEPKIAGIVQAGSFSPAPKVDSAILVIENISKNRFSFSSSLRGRLRGGAIIKPLLNPPLSQRGGGETLKQNEWQFFEIVRAGFAHKRKFVASNLKSVFGEKTKEKMAACGIPQAARPENLTVKNWLCLARN